jgi:cell division protein ZapE
MVCGAGRVFHVAKGRANQGAMTTVQDLYAARVASGAITPDAAQEAVLPELERIRVALEHPVKRGLFRRTTEPVRGLYLWGGVGRGKSMLMDLLTETVTVPKWRRHFHAFMQWAQGGMNAARARGVDDPIVPVADEIIREVKFLAFDEMQITDIADAMIVGRLFERLFAAGITVVTTSNRHPSGLYEDGLNRALFLPFIAMLEERMVVMELAGPLDHREGRLKGEETYFTPVDAAARVAVDRIFDSLTHGLAQPLVMRVYGREVEIPAFHNGVARATFYDLCGRPLGPADYLALAQAARVLVIDDIPLLSADNYNMARRFVILIDALYEAKVRLICSAAARPEMLYLEGEGTFEFGRTVSRLKEMQAADWGRDA